MVSHYAVSRIKLNASNDPPAAFKVTVDAAVTRAAMRCGWGGSTSRRARLACAGRRPAWRSTSLCCHLLFALQAIPLAAFTAYSAGGFFLGSWLGARNTDKLLAKIEAEPDLEKRKALAAPYLARSSSFKKWRTTFIIAAFAAAGVSFAVGSYVSALATAVAGVLVLLQKGWEDFRQLDRKASAFGAVLFILLLAFLTGYERAGYILKTNAASENIVMDDKTTPARIIRSGERGVLFLSTDTKKLKFIRWEAIKQIDTL